MRSPRERNTQTIEPMRCRSGEIMARILSQCHIAAFLQVVHFAGARGFDEPHWQKNVSFRNLSDMNLSEMSFCHTRQGPTDCPQNLGFRDSDLTEFSAHPPSKGTVRRFFQERS